MKASSALGLIILTAEVAGIALFLICGQTMYSTLIAKYYICLSRQQAWWAAGLATIITLFSVFVIEQIIIGHAFWGLLFYGFGTGAGTFWAIRKSK